MYPGLTEIQLVNIIFNLLGIGFVFGIVIGMFRRALFTILPRKGRET